MPQAPLTLLCVEPNFPGHLGLVADWLVRKRGYRCYFAFNTAATEAQWPESTNRGLELLPYKVGGVAREQVVPWTSHLERSLCYAYGAWEVIDARRLRAIDLVLARSGGLGSSLFLPVTFPRVPIVQRLDYYLQPRSGDLANEDAASLPVEYVHWRRSANAVELLELENQVVPWTTSAWQRDLFPSEYRDSFVVIPEPIASPGTRVHTRECTTLAGRSIAPGTKLVTFVATVPDRLRGFDRFVELAARLVEAREDVVCVVAGAGAVGRMLDVRHFGTDYANAQIAASYLSTCNRFWNLGSIDAGTVSALFERTNLHVYPSRSYPCARSLFEALSAGSLVLASDTPAVREIIEHGKTGLLAREGDAEDLFRKALDALERPDDYAHVGERAERLFQERFACEQVMPQLATLFEQVVHSASGRSR
jgi:glycosyltransferase involved in cell wall biosynthesis